MMCFFIGPHHGKCNSHLQEAQTDGISAAHLRQRHRKQQRGRDENSPSAQEVREGIEPNSVQVACTQQARYARQMGAQG